MSTHFTVNTYCKNVFAICEPFTKLKLIQQAVHMATKTLEEGSWCDPYLSGAATLINSGQKS